MRPKREEVTVGGIKSHNEERTVIYVYFHPDVIKTPEEKNEKCGSCTLVRITERERAI